MSRRHYNIDEQKTQKFLAERRGQGEGADYLPWLKIQSLPSLGRSHRTFGIKTNRVHHFLSDGEWKCFLMLESDPTVIDVREQFPMDRHGTYKAAADLGYKHPRTSDGTPYVMTIDFLVTRILESGRVLTPYTFKYTPQKLGQRDQELIEIASKFWSEKGLRLEVIDENFFNNTVIKNYDSIRACHNLSKLAFYSRTDVSTICNDVVDAFRTGTDQSVASLCTSLSQAHSASAQEIFSVFKHLLARGVIRTDLTNETPLGKRFLFEFSSAIQSGG